MILATCQYLSINYYRLIVQYPVNELSSSELIIRNTVRNEILRNFESLFVPIMKAYSRSFGYNFDNPV